MEEYVQVPVPKRFVARVYALLAKLTAAEGGADSALDETTSPPKQEQSSQPDRSRSDLRYQLLGEFLGRMHQSDLLRLSMEQIEQICDGKLPESAYKHRAWWANTDSHSHAQSWQRAGFRVARVDFDWRKRVSGVIFRNVGTLS